jgi:hypothetical protein
MKIKTTLQLVPGDVLDHEPLIIVLSVCPHTTIKSLRNVTYLLNDRVLTLADGVEGTWIVIE